MGIGPAIVIPELLKKTSTTILNKKKIYLISIFGRLMKLLRAKQVTVLKNSELIRIK